MLIRLCCKLQWFDGYRDIRFGTWVNNVSFERWIEVLNLSLVGFVFDCSGLLIAAIFGHEFFDFSRSWLLWLLVWFIVYLVWFPLFHSQSPPRSDSYGSMLGTLPAATIGPVQIRFSLDPIRSGLDRIPIGLVLDPPLSIFSILGPAGSVRSRTDEHPYTLSRNSVTAHLTLTDGNCSC